MSSFLAHQPVFIVVALQVLYLHHLERKLMAKLVTIDQIQDAVVAVISGYNTSVTEDKVKSVALFGSHAANTANADSDIDLLIEFDSPFVSLFVLGRLLTELEDALKASVDLVPLPLPERSFIVLDKVVYLYAA